MDLQRVIYLPSAGLLISLKHLSQRGGGAVELASLPLKTRHNTFIYWLYIAHTFSLSLSSFFLSYHYLAPLHLFSSLLSPHSPPSLLYPSPFLLVFFFFIIISRDPPPANHKQNHQIQQHDNTGENDMQQPDVITMCPLSSISPPICPVSQPSLSLPLSLCDISSSNRRQVLSRLPS